MEIDIYITLFIIFLWPYELMGAPYTTFRCDTNVGLLFDKFLFFFLYCCGFYIVLLYASYFVLIVVVIADCAQYCPEVSCLGLSSVSD